MMRKTILCTMLGVIYSLFALPQSDAIYRFVSNGNPVVTHKFTADPSALVVGDTLWVFTGEDAAPNQKGYRMKNWCVFATTDLKNWTEYPTPLHSADFAWDKVGNAYAGHVIERNGKYYWFISTNRYGIGVAVSDYPQGPYTDVLGKPLLTRDDCSASSHFWACIDPAVFIDDDGQAWLFWGNGQCYYVKLKENMIETEGEIQQVQFEGFDFTEAPWIHRYKNTYYLTYATGFPEKIAYATAKNIAGPYSYGGLLNEVAGNSNTNHQSIVEFKGKWYFVYHNGALQNGGTGYSRSVCIDQLNYKRNGALKRIIMTSEGVNYQFK